MTAALCTCRFCGSDITLSLADLGAQPPSNSYLTNAEAEEKTFPLRAVVCENCHLVQLADDVPADEIFNADYAYFSSFSASWVAHAKSYAETMIERFGLGADSKVVEIASNDGYLLQHFVNAGVQVLGVDPASGCAAAARAKGVADRSRVLQRRHRDAPESRRPHRRPDGGQQRLGARARHPQFRRRL